MNPERSPISHQLYTSFGSSDSLSPRPMIHVIGVNVGQSLITLGAGVLGRVASL